MIRAIIFDLDGTLVDAYPGLHKSLNEMLRALGLPEVSIEIVKRRVGRGVENLMQQSVPAEMVHRALQLFRESYERTHISGTNVLADVPETLQALHAKNIFLAVASNKPPDFTRNILKHLELESYFSMIAGPEGNIQPKPNPSMLRSMIEHFSLERAETLYLGDMTLDAETARNAGVRPALIATGGHTREELEREEPDYLLDRFSDLLAIIDTEV